jgi:hypothetical protein
MMETAFRMSQPGTTVLLSLAVLSISGEEMTGNNWSVHGESSVVATASINKVMMLRMKITRAAVCKRNQTPASKR